MKTLLLSLLSGVLTIFFSHPPQSPITFTVSYDHMLACETGEGPCDTLQFVRPADADYVKLVMPCGGTQTTLILHQADFNHPISEQHFRHEDCPPQIDLTGLADGIYMVNVFSCGLGGGLTFDLTTAP
ncbi:MAG: hypothetical protein AAF206_03425 [Bacteroidota bacterium]